MDSDIDLGTKEDFPFFFELKFVGRLDLKSRFNVLN